MNIQKLKDKLDVLGVRADTIIMYNPIINWKYFILMKEEKEK